jgi:hypothetical protein
MIVKNGYIDAKAINCAGMITTNKFACPEVFGEDKYAYNLKRRLC